MSSSRSTQRLDSGTSISVEERGQPNKRRQPITPIQVTS
jgi:hypothetical protein